MDEPAGGERDAGLRPTLQRLVAGGIALARTRLELASVELAEERARFTSIVALAVAGAVLATLALAAFAFMRAAAVVKRQPTPFAATIAEFDKDRRRFAGGRPNDISPPTGGTAP